MGMAGVWTVRLAAGQVRLAVWIWARPWARITAVARTVLIVDDHPSFRASARRMLEADGYEVVGEAVDGTSAVAAARELHPDVVLLDIRLPDLDGFQVAERLAVNGESPAIVLTSSRDRSDFGDDIDACPAHGFIPKSELSAEAIALLIR
jgi:DNA-binding NarL/FixJ family response regulator